MSDKKTIEKIKNRLFLKKRKTGTDEFVLACLYLDESEISKEHKEALDQLIKIKMREMRLEDDLKRAASNYEKDGRRLTAGTLDAMSATQAVVARAKPLIDVDVAAREEHLQKLKDERELKKSEKREQGFVQPIVTQPPQKQVQPPQVRTSQLPPHSSVFREN